MKTPPFFLPASQFIIDGLCASCVRPAPFVHWMGREVDSFLDNSAAATCCHPHQCAHGIPLPCRQWPHCGSSCRRPPPPYCSHCASRVGHHLYLFPHVSPSFLAPEQKTRRLDSICISDWFIGLFFCRKIGIFFSPHANQIYPSKNMKKGRGQGRGNTSMALKEVHFFFLFFFYKRHRKTQNTHTNACMDQFVLVTSHPTRGETTHTDTMDRSRQFQHTADFTPHLLYLSKNPCLPPEVCRSSDA